MHNAVEQIKERLNIVEVIGSYVQLQKAGRHFKGKSPFTNEKTPSFFVSPERGMYYCFSSAKGGDIFTFIQEMEGVDFKGALKILAERAHVELVPIHPQKRTEQEMLYALLDAATAYFEAALKEQNAILGYLKERGVTDQSIAKWRIGYAPDGWRHLKDHLAQKGFDDRMLLRSGLIKRALEGNSLYDTFRDRVMFPINDSAGRIVAFSGRAMKSDPALPKYLNSPETELYEKSRILFGYHRAKQRIRTLDFSLIVEGQFDLVLAHQVGFTNTVALSGTALSPPHSALLERLSRRAVLALDADRAGVNSVQRAAHIMLARGMDVKVALLPEGKDPADLITEDPLQFKAAVRDAATVVEFLIEIIKKTTRDERAFRLRVRDEVLPLIIRIPNHIDREHFEGVVSRALSSTQDAVHHEVERIAHTESAAPLTAPAAAAVPVGTQHAHAYRTDELIRFAYGILLWQAQQEKGESESAFDTVEMSSALKEAVGEDSWSGLVDLTEQDKNKLIFEVELHCAELAVAELLSLFHNYLKEIEERKLKLALRGARERLREAERAGDAEAINTMLSECAVLQRRLSTIGSGFRA